VDSREARSATRDARTAGSIVCVGDRVDGRDRLSARRRVMRGALRFRARRPPHAPHRAHITAADVGPRAVPADGQNDLAGR